MRHVIVITGASSGFGALIARELAKARHMVYAGTRGTTTRNVPQVEVVRKFAQDDNVDLCAIELDVATQDSLDSSMRQIPKENGHLDVVIPNAGHMVYGPAEAFTPEQLAALYDINVLSRQRVNRAALPVLRKRGQGLVLWICSTSTGGGTPPYLAPYFAAKQERPRTHRRSDRRPAREVEEFFVGQGMPKGRTEPRAERVDGFNLGRIHLGVPGAEHVTGTTSLMSAIASIQMRSWCSFWKPIVPADHSAAGSSHRRLRSPFDEHPYVDRSNHKPGAGLAKLEDKTVQL